MLSENRKAKTKAKPIVTPKHGLESTSPGKKRALFNLRTRTKNKDKEVQHVGELPNRSKIQAKAKAQRTSQNILQLGGEAKAVNTSSNATTTISRVGDSPGSLGMRLNLASPASRSLGGAWSIFGNNGVPKAELLVDTDDDATSVSSDPSSNSTGKLTRKELEDKLYVPNSNATARLFSLASEASASTESTRAGLDPPSGVAQFVGDLQWIPIVPVTPSDAAASDSVSVSSDQSDLRGTRRNKIEKGRGLLKTEERLASSMATQVAKIQHQSKDSIGIAMEKVQINEDDGDDNNPISDKLSEQSREWHGVLGPVELVCTKPLKEKDNIESAPARKKRGKRKKKESRNQEHSLASDFQQSILLPPEAELDFSNPSMPSLSTFTTEDEDELLVAEACTEQPFRATVASDPSNGITRDLNAPNMSGKTYETPRISYSLDSAESSSMENSANVAGDVDKGPGWLPVTHHTKSCNEIHIDVDHEEESVALQPKGGMLKQNEDSKNATEFETLSASIPSVGSSLGGSSTMIEIMKEDIIPEVASAVRQGSHMEAKDTYVDDGNGHWDIKMANDQHRRKVDKNPPNLVQPHLRLSKDDIIEINVDYSSNNFESARDGSPPAPISSSAESRNQWCFEKRTSHLNIESERHASDGQTKKSKQHRPNNLAQVSGNQPDERLTNDRLHTETSWSSAIPQDRNEMTVSHTEQELPSRKPENALRSPLQLDSNKLVEVEEESGPFATDHRWHRVPVGKTHYEDICVDDLRDQTAKSKNVGLKRRTTKAKKRLHSDNESSTKGAVTSCTTRARRGRRKEKQHSRSRVTSAGSSRGDGGRGPIHEIEQMDCHYVELLSLGSVSASNEIVPETPPKNSPPSTIEQRRGDANTNPSNGSRSLVGATEVNHCDDAIPVRGASTLVHQRIGNSPRSVSESEAQLTATLVVSDTLSVGSNLSSSGASRQTHTPAWVRMEPKGTRGEHLVNGEDFQVGTKPKQAQRTHESANDAVTLFQTVRDAAFNIDSLSSDQQIENVPFEQAILELATNPSTPAADEMPPSDDSERLAIPEDSKLANSHCENPHELSTEFSDDAIEFADLVPRKASIENDEGPDLLRPTESNKPGGRTSSSVVDGLRPKKKPAESRTNKFLPSTLMPAQLADSTRDNLAVSRDGGVNPKAWSKHRQQREQRGAAMNSVLFDTKNKSISGGSILLELKRKLVQSQTLVQELKFENSQIRRQSTLDVAKANTAMLQYLHKRETELEEQVNNLMAERNAAVQECRELRMIVEGSCETCRKQLPETELVVDASVRWSRLHRGQQWLTSAWFSGSLSSAARVKTDTSHVTSQRHVGNESDGPLRRGLSRHHST